MVLRLLAAIVAVACVADDMPLVPPPTTDAHESASRPAMPLGCLAPPPTTDAHESAANKVDVLGFTLGDAIPDGVEKKKHDHRSTEATSSHRWCEISLWASEIDGSVEYVYCGTTSVDRWVLRLRTRYGRETFSSGALKFWCRPGHVVVTGGEVVVWFRYSDPCSTETGLNVAQHALRLLLTDAVRANATEQEDF